MKDPTWDQWLAALADLKHPVEVRQLGFTRCAADWRIRPRRLDEHLLYYVVDQSCVGQADGRRLRLDAHDLLWLSPGVAHQFTHGVNSGRMRLYHLRFVLRTSSHPWPAPQPVLLQRKASNLRPLFEPLYDEHQVDLSHSETRFRAWLILLFTSIERNLAAAVPSGTTLDRTQRQRLLALVHELPDRRLTPADLARRTGLSADYFTRVFRRTFGIPPRTWLLHERMRLAAQRLVESDLSIGEIADAFGYEDLYLFSRQFKQVMSLSPRSYRQRHVQGEGSMNSSTAPSISRQLR